MSNENDRSITDAIDEIMRHPDGVVGDTFRELVTALGRYGIVAYREKFTSTYLKSFNFASKTIVDVGVNDGTPNLWNAFKDKKIVLIEPLEDILLKTKESYPDFDFHLIPAGAGSEEGELTINVMPVSGHSSFRERQQLPDHTRSVPVIRLDAVLKDFTPPFGIKIDTEGFEVEVIKGCSGIAEHVEFFIAEISIKRIYSDGYYFSEVIRHLAEYGFELIDILNSFGGRPNNLDCLFVRRDSELLQFIPTGEKHA